MKDTFLNRSLDNAQPIVEEFRQKLKDHFARDGFTLNEVVDHLSDLKPLLRRTKRRVTSFNMFYRELYETHAFKGDGFRERNAEITKLWKRIDESKKDEYKALAKRASVAIATSDEDKRLAIRRLVDDMKNICAQLSNYGVEVAGIIVCSEKYGQYNATFGTPLGLKFLESHENLYFNVTGLVNYINLGQSVSLHRKELIKMLDTTSSPADVPLAPDSFEQDTVQPSSDASDVFNPLSPNSCDRELIKTKSTKIKKRDLFRKRLLYKFNEALKQANDKHYREELDREYQCMPQHWDTRLHEFGLKLVSPKYSAEKLRNFGRYSSQATLQLALGDIEQNLIYFEPL